MLVLDTLFCTLALDTLYALYTLSCTLCTLCLVYNVLYALSYLYTALFWTVHILLRTLSCALDSKHLVLNLLFCMLYSQPSVLNALFYTPSSGHSVLSALSYSISPAGRAKPCMYNALSCSVLDALSCTLYPIYVDCGQTCLYHYQPLRNRQTPRLLRLPILSYSYVLLIFAKSDSLYNACFYMLYSLRSACPVLHTLCYPLCLYALPACLHASIYVPTPYPSTYLHAYALPSALAVSVYILQMNIYVFIQLLLHSAPNPLPVSFNHSYKSSLSYLP